MFQTRSLACGAAVLSLVFSALLPRTSLGDCVDYSDVYSHLIGSQVTGIISTSDLAISGNYAYVAGNGTVAGHDVVFEVIDISNPTIPSVVGTLQGYPINSGYGVAVSGSYAYLTDPNEGQLRVIDISNPMSPALVASVHSTSRTGAAVAASGDYLYLACPDETASPNGLGGHLQVIDVSKPTKPVTVANAPAPEFPCGSLVVSGSYAYVLGGKSESAPFPYGVKRTFGIRVFDISNPRSPFLVGGLTRSSLGNTSEEVWLAIDLAEPYLYVAGFPSFQVINVSNPAAPVIVDSLAVAGYDLAVQGSTAYLGSAGGSDSLHVINILNPLSPSIIGKLKGPGASVVRTTSSYLFTNGIRIYPLQCSPTVDVVLSSFQASSTAEGILLEWTASEDANVLGFHVQRSLSPETDYEQLTTSPILGSPYRFLDTKAEAGFTYYYRLELLRRTGTKDFFGPVSVRFEPDTNKPALGPATPNPFSSSTSIPFSLSRSAPVIVRVLDLSGRQVRIVLDQSLESGSHTAVWDGRNDTGELAAAGIYVFELQTQGWKSTRRMVRLP